MKYVDFKKTKNLDLQLLFSLDALEYSTHIFKLDNYPDFDLSKYDKHSDQTYFFSNELPFPDQFDTILRVDDELVRIFTYDDLERLSKEHQVEFEEGKTRVELLREIQKHAEDLTQEGTEPDFDGFKLHSVKINGINNTSKIISVLGGYSADAQWIEPYDCTFTLFCHLLGIPKRSTRKHLHLGLIAEGYALYEARNFGLSFFILYTAIECYISTTLGTHDDQRRLSEKLQQLFKDTFPSGDLNTHQIYTSIVGEFQGYTNIRNMIAHGENAAAISESEARNILLFALILIASVKFASSTFRELKARITHE